MNIFQKLIKLRTNAYAKYSRYSVACIVIDQNNNQYEGVNVENAVFPLTICAERSAVANAVANGVKTIKEVHLLCSNDNDFGIPCGSCRQVLVEFMDLNDYVYVYNDKGDVQKYKLAQLLPFAFTNKYLGGDFDE